MPPRRASSPVAARSTSSRTRRTPTRLGQNDGFGESAAGSWSSPAPKSSSKSSFSLSKKGSSFVGPSDVICVAAAVATFAYGLPAAVPLDTPPMPAFALIAAVAASAHVLYGCVWFFSKGFKKACKKVPLKLLGKNAVAVFAVLVTLAKVLQQLTLVAWAVDYKLDAALPLVTSIPPNQALIGGALVLAGQLLNGAIYKAIGRDGVYYGFKLGRPVKWSTAFPFSAGFRHPQYVGGFTSQLGVLLALASPSTIAAGLVPLAAFWGLCYVATSIIEASGDNDD